MIRKAFVMEVLPGKESEYERRHNPIWPALEQVLHDHGVRTYSIFLHPVTRQLFGYAEVESEERWASVAQTAVCRQWWTWMREIMPVNSDNSPVTTSLKEVFRLPDRSRAGEVESFSRGDHRDAS